MLRISDFLGVMFTQKGRNGPASKTKCTYMFRPVRQLVARAGRQTTLFVQVRQVAVPEAKCAVSGCILLLLLSHIAAIDGVPWSVCRSRRIRCEWTHRVRGVDKVVCINTCSRAHARTEGPKPEACQQWMGFFGREQQAPSPPDRGFGERCKLPQRGPGRAAEEVGFGAPWGYKNHQFQWFCIRLGHDTVFGQVVLKSQRGRGLKPEHAGLSPH